MGRNIFSVLVMLLTFGAWFSVYADEGKDTGYSYFAESDTVLRGYTLDDVERYRNIYLRKISQLENERKQLRQKGIRDGEIFLSRHPESKIGDKVMMRLAELYYEQAQENYQNKMQEYDRLYNLYEKGDLRELPVEPQKELSSALNLYADVIEAYPASELVDDAFYNVGFILEEVGLSDSARVYYSKVITDFPASPLLPDVNMRLGEYYFNPPVNDLWTAIEYYEKVLKYRSSPRYDEALYRLGWSYYRLSDYPRAIAYFTLLADDVKMTKPFDPNQKYSNPSLVDESVEYIGLSFLEFGGSENAAKYLDEIGGREYGIQILKRIGDAYMDEKEDYDNALTAYNLLLKLYPNSPIAPSIQNKIVQAYRRLENSLMAYISRDLLFSRYKTDSDWWKINTDIDVREQAYALTESALRDNISVLLNRGQEANQIDLYEQSVVESRKYIESFPADSSSALIHWNMALTLDTKLNKKLEAYHEYIKISNLYWDSKYQRLAAENAVALAKEDAAQAIKLSMENMDKEEEKSIDGIRKQVSQSSNNISFRDKLKLQPTELSVEEQRLSDAYDNYIKLFPHAKQTPLFLANAGALYYRHHQFQTALKYFNTLLKHFPGSEEMNQARYAIMESYFGKGDFQSSEIVARRIIYDDVSEELQSKARRRLAESIFLSAELLAHDDKHIEAGNEYRRVVKEVPRSEFADLALFNAALEFDKAQNYMRAIETYNYLLATHPNSGYVLDAQNNLAFDYAELNDYRNAALTYERIATIHPDLDKARDALFNASLYFARAEDWENAIKINNLFIQRFPNDDAADDLAYEIAGFYRKQNEYEKAQTAYESFVTRYPNSPRVVEALYNRGSYFRMMGQAKNAIVEFQKALSRSKKLEAMGLDRNDYFAAETEFSLAMTKYEEFESIQFRLPQTQLDASKQQKRDLLLEIVRHLGDCAAYGTSRLYEATYMIGFAYQEFASSWADQDIPEMEKTRKVVARKEVNDAAIELYDRSANAYRSAIVGLTDLADKYKIVLFDEKTKDSTQVLTAADSLAITSQDTVLRIADRWINSSKTNLTEVNFNIAEISLRSAEFVLDAPEPEGLGVFPLLVYRKQILDIAVKPLLSEAFNAYKRNLVEADSFKIESQWVELSKKKLISSKNLMPLVYSKLSFQALEKLEPLFNQYNNIATTNTDFDLIFDELRNSSDEIANIIDFSKQLRLEATSHFKENILVSKELGIEDVFLTTSKDTLMSHIYNYAILCDSTSKKAKVIAEEYRNQYIKTEAPVYEEGLFVFEGNYFTLRDIERDVLENGYNLSKELSIDNIYTKNLTLQLVKFDPEQYAKILDLKVVPTVIGSDTTWLASENYYEHWTKLDFDENLFNNAVKVPNQAYGFAPALWAYYREIDQDTTKADSLVLAPLMAAKQAFIRKSFALKGLPVSCNIKVSANLPFNLYFNGDLITRYVPQDSAVAFKVFDVSDLLSKGKNSVAFEVSDDQLTEQGVRCVINIRSLPDWDTKVESLRPDLMSETAQEKLMLEKGRIP